MVCCRLLSLIFSLKKIILRLLKIFELTSHEPFYTNLLKWNFESAIHKRQTFTSVNCRHFKSFPSFLQELKIRKFKTLKFISICSQRFDFDEYLTLHTNFETPLHYASIQLTSWHYPLYPHINIVIPPWSECKNHNSHVPEKVAHSTS